MKNSIILTIICLMPGLSPGTYGQTFVSDKSIRYQQERMVF
ncbi:hypothetical protein ACVW2L_001487 [Mucilaginibacter sp. HD30]